MEYNYFDVLNGFHELKLAKVVGSKASSLFMALLYKANKLRFPESLAVFNSELQDLSGLSKDEFYPARNKLLQTKMNGQPILTYSNNGTKNAGAYQINYQGFKHYFGDYSGITTNVPTNKKDYSDYTTKGTTNPHTNPHTNETPQFNSGNTSRTPLNKQTNNIYIYTIFEHWNSKKITVHRELTASLQSHINARLEKYPLQILLDAISNYAKILQSDEYFFTYKWGLSEFLNPKNMDKFLSENNPFTNYRKDKGKNVTPSPNRKPERDLVALAEADEHASTQ